MTISELKKDFYEKWLEAYKYKLNFLDKMYSDAISQTEELYYTTVDQETRHIIDKQLASFKKMREDALRWDNVVEEMESMHGIISNLFEGR